MTGSKGNAVDGLITLATLIFGFAGAIIVVGLLVEAVVAFLNGW